MFKVMLIKQLYRFSLVGVFGAGFNYGTFLVCYLVFGIGYMYSSFIGFVFAGVLAYRFSKGWVFIDSYKKKKYQFISFMSLMLVSLVSGLIVLNLSTENLLIDPVFSQILSMGTTTVVNFVGSKYFVFQ